MAKKPPMSSDGKGALCTYCRRTLQSSRAYSAVAATRDYVHPKSLGGTRKVWCCFACNNLKGSKTAFEWSRFMSENPEWWKKFTARNGPRRPASMLRNHVEQ